MTKINVRMMNGEFVGMYDVCNWSVTEFDVLQVGFETASGALTNRYFPLRNVLSYEVTATYDKSAVLNTAGEG